ncbi:TfoX/Sxy family protein [Actinoplanes sp. TFC3]|uniref:TfoX/Sxy family protein n=1 Tax=Actinoplanes sp. TFC3 TaxID=1710355 RepID=UPI00082E376A|nr:TfoX/Sxy family protein [Actinoplanes sp. TFC3]
MAYDAALAERLRDLLAPRPGILAKPMFGGLCFLSDGNMLVCIWGDDLMVRVGREATEEALRHPGTRPCDVTGRPMRGWVVVDGEQLDDETLEQWVKRAGAFVATLVPK